jgi:hypothetical protein
MHPEVDVADTTQGARAARTIVDFAEDLGRVLGTAQAKASNWLNQRKNVIEELTQLRDTANQLLGELTGSASASTAPGRRSRGGRRRGARTGSATSGATKTARAGGRRQMSAAARRAVSERMRKYWAERRKAKGAKA